MVEFESSAAATVSTESRRSRSRLPGDDRERFVGGVPAACRFTTGLTGRLAVFCGEVMAMARGRRRLLVSEICPNSQEAALLGFRFPKHETAARQENVAQRLQLDSTRLITFGPTTRPAVHTPRQAHVTAFGSLMEG